MKRLGFALTILTLLLVPGSAQARDRDHDRLPDSWEKRFHISTKSKSGAKDRDRDGLTNRGEFLARTSPRRADTDRDHILDDDEDRDRDRVDNGNEEDEGTRPRDRDTDNDGIRDGSEDRDRDRLTNRDEDRTGNNPRDRDSDDDGVLDGAERAGAVSGFAGAVLTIDLANGAFVTGTVTEATEFDCQTEDEAEYGRVGPGGRASQTDEDGPDGGEGDDGSEPGEDADDVFGPVGNDEVANAACSRAALGPGAPVHAAKGQLTVLGLVFTEVQLIR
jgi:hypothetical protein